MMNQKYEAPIEELNDDELDSVVGGISVGDTIHIRRGRVEYCPTCGRLVMDINATVTGIRGQRNGVTYYWISYQCCGHRTSVGDDVIV